MIVQPFPSFFSLGTMASADFSQFVVTMRPFEYVDSFAPVRPPRVSVITFASYICCIYTLKFGQYPDSLKLRFAVISGFGLCFVMETRPFQNALYAISVRQTEALPAGILLNPHIRLPSDPTSRWSPLSSANSSYCQVCSGLSPPSCNTCQAHIKNRRCGDASAIFVRLTVN